MLYIFFNHGNKHNIVIFVGNSTKNLVNIN